MQTTAPEVGKTYISQVDPDFRITVTKVEQDDDDIAGFFVEGCAPGTENDMSAIGFDLIAEEWANLRFTPQP